MYLRSITFSLMMEIWLFLVWFLLIAWSGKAHKIFLSIWILIGSIPAWHTLSPSTWSFIWASLPSWWLLLTLSLHNFDSSSISIVHPYFKGPNLASASLRRFCPLDHSLSWIQITLPSKHSIIPSCFMVSGFISTTKGLQKKCFCLKCLSLIDSANISLLLSPVAYLVHGRNVVATQ